VTSAGEPEATDMNRPRNKNFMESTNIGDIEQHFAVDLLVVSLLLNNGLVYNPLWLRNLTILTRIILAAGVET
jgi:hypothetical protein